MFKAKDFICSILILPSVAHHIGLGHPIIHTPGTEIEGYRLPFDKLGFESVPIKGFTHSTGSLTFATI